MSQRHQQHQFLLPQVLKLVRQPPERLAKVPKSQVIPLLAQPVRSTPGQLQEVLLGASFSSWERVLSPSGSIPDGKGQLDHLLLHTILWT
jgi:hypothetical protein